jgi:hypothetical protein
MVRPKRKSRDLSDSHDSSLIHSLTHVIGVEKNITLAKLLNAKAGELEAVYTTYAPSWATTNGAAPDLASTLASLELWTLQFDSMRHWLRGTGEAER